MNKDLAIARILSGCIILSDNLIYKTPTRIERYKAELLVEHIIKTNKYEECMSRSEALNYIIRRNWLEKDYQKRLDKLVKDIEDTKLNMFQRAKNLDFAAVKLFRKNLAKIEAEISYIKTMEKLIDSYTIEGYADKQKADYLLRCGCFNINNERVEIQDDQLDGLHSLLSAASYSIKEYRELARTDPWRTYWGADKENIFGLAASDWSEEQKIIVSFSRMYDSAYKHPECPVDMILEDDDLFDGWMIFQKKKSNEDQKEVKGGDQFILPTKSVMMKDDQGYYTVKVPITDKEELEQFRQQVDDSNTYEAKQIKKKRAEALKKKGKLQEAELPDVRQDLEIKANNLMKEKVKRGV